MESDPLNTTARRLLLFIATYHLIAGVVISVLALNAVITAHNESSDAKFSDAAMEIAKSWSSSNAHEIAMITGQIFAKGGAPYVEPERTLMAAQQMIDRFTMGIGRPERRSKWIYVVDVHVHTSVDIGETESDGMAVRNIDVVLSLMVDLYNHSIMLVHTHAGKWDKL